MDMNVRGWIQMGWKYFQMLIQDGFKPWVLIHESQIHGWTWLLIQSGYALRMDTSLGLDPAELKMYLSVDAGWIWILSIESWITDTRLDLIVDPIWIRLLRMDTSLGLDPDELKIYLNVDAGWIWILSIESWIGHRFDLIIDPI